MSETRGELPTIGETIAKQALIAFSDNPEQNPVARYKAGDEQGVNVGDFGPGTILRVEHFDFSGPAGASANDGKPKYDWFVVGDRYFNRPRSREEILIYEMFVSSQQPDDPHLKKTDRASIFRASSVDSREAISVTNAKSALGGYEISTETERHREVFPATRLDVMVLMEDLEKTQPIDLDALRASTK